MFRNNQVFQLLWLKSFVNKPPSNNAQVPLRDLNESRAM